VTACFVPSSPSFALYRLLSNACNLNKIFIATMPSSSLLGREKGSKLRCKRGRNSCQHLKTNKENHVSRFIRGIPSTSQGFLASRRSDCAFVFCGFYLLISRDSDAQLASLAARVSCVNFDQHSPPAKLIRSENVSSNFNSDSVLDRTTKENRTRKCHSGNKTSNFILVLI
jgi:hypothetical protein